MPGFCFSPAMIGHKIVLISKDGLKIPGEVVEANPAEIVLKNPSDDQSLIRVNRDDVISYSGFDDKQRVPDKVRLTLTRCFNKVTKCNGVKKIDIDPVTKKILQSECSAYNVECETMNCSIFEMKKESLVKLFQNMQVNEYPTKKGDD